MLRRHAPQSKVRPRVRTLVHANRRSGRATRFTDVVEHVWDVATAVTSAAQWEQYVTWLTACWQGRVDEVMADLDRWQEALGEPPPDAAESDPREVVRLARGWTRYGTACRRWRSTRLDATGLLGTIGKLNPQSQRAPCPKGDAPRRSAGRPIDRSRSRAH